MSSACAHTAMSHNRLSLSMYMLRPNMEVGLRRMFLVRRGQGYRRSRIHVDFLEKVGLHAVDAPFALI